MEKAEAKARAEQEEKERLEKERLEKEKIERELKKIKILTRKGPGVDGYEDYLRITLGPKKQMKNVISVLNKYFK